MWDYSTLRPNEYVQMSRRHFELSNPSLRALWHRSRCSRRHLRSPRRSTRKYAHNTRCRFLNLREINKAIRIIIYYLNIRTLHLSTDLWSPDSLLQRVVWSRCWMKNIAPFQLCCRPISYRTTTSRTRDPTPLQIRNTLLQVSTFFMRPRNSAMPRSGKGDRLFDLG